MSGPLCVICKKRAAGPDVLYCAECEEHADWIPELEALNRETHNLERNEAERPDRKAYAQRVEAPPSMDSREWFESFAGALDVELPPGSLLHLGQELDPLFDACKALTEAGAWGFKLAHLEGWTPMMALMIGVIGKVIEVEHKGRPEFMGSTEWARMILNRYRVHNGLQAVGLRRFQELDQQAKDIIRAYRETGEIPTRRPKRRKTPEKQP